MSAFDSFPETIDINRRSVSISSGMNQQTSLNNLLNPLESRLSNNAVSSADTSSGNAVSHTARSSGVWNSNESSSSLVLQNQSVDEEVKMDERWSSLVGPHAIVGPQSEERQFEPTNVHFPERHSIGNGNQLRSGSLFLQGMSSTNVFPNSFPSARYASGNGGQHTVAVLGSNRLNAGGLEIEQASSSGVSSDDVTTSSGASCQMTEENNGSWGLSCKRKTLEGTSSSGQSCPGGSSSCFPQAENGSWLSGSIPHNGGLSFSSALRSFNVGPPEQPNLRIGSGVRGVASEAFPSSSTTGNAELLRNVDRTEISGHQQDPVTSNLSGARHSNVWSLQQSLRPVPFSDSLDLRSSAPTSLSAAQVQPHGMQLFSSSRNMPSCPWNRSSDRGAGNPPSPLIFGERVTASPEEANLRSILRNSGEHPVLLPPHEMTNMAQDQTGWSFAGNTSTSGHGPSTRTGLSSSVHHLPTSSWIAHHNPSIHNQQRFSEFSPWSLFPSMDSEPESHSGHFLPLPSGSSASSQETAMASGSSSQGHNQPFSRPAFLLEGQGDDALGMPRSLRALAADIEGRHRLISEIRQVLNAMRRGENLRVEDYMLFDPFVYNGMAEFHDRHRDMRLDVDNMSYEELLALEERIGDVSTGLSEATIVKLIKQQKYVFAGLESRDVEPCCICQEEYADGDDVVKLDCGHDFHTSCIKQWLMMKNICPICKMTALPT